MKAITLLGKMMTEEKPTRPPCDCGNPHASWHGDRCGLRSYMCDKCWREQKMREALIALANHVEHQAYRLGLKVPPAHGDYVSKQGAAANLMAYVRDARTALGETEPTRGLDTDTKTV